MSQAEHDNTNNEGGESTPSGVDAQEMGSGSLVVDAECQTSSDFMEEYQKTKSDLVLFKQVNQDLCSAVADLKSCEGSIVKKSTSTQTIHIIWVCIKIGTSPKDPL